MCKRTDGFTLVELMVVVLIIGILVAVAVPVFKSARDTAEWNTCQANQRTILGAIEAFNANEGAPLNVTAEGGIPAGVGGFLTNAIFTDQRFIPDYLKAVPRCPTVRRLWDRSTWEYNTKGVYYLGRHTGDDGAIHIVEEATGAYMFVPHYGWSPGHRSLDPYAGYDSDGPPLP